MSPFNNESTAQIVTNIIFRPLADGLIDFMAFKLTHENMYFTSLILL